MERIEEFSQEEKNFIYLDFSGIFTNEKLIELIETFKPVIAKYRENSLYTISNINNIRFDSESGKIVADYLKHNKPYVKHGAIIGLDGVKKNMLSCLIKSSGRNMHFAFTKERAIEWLLKQD